MKRLIFVVLGMTLAGAARADVSRYNITPEEHAACDADAVSLCASAYPDEEKMLACMKTNLSNLSARCSAAFTSGLRKRHIPL